MAKNSFSKYLMILMIALVALSPANVFSAELSPAEKVENLKNKNPKLANYFLKWTIYDWEVPRLAQWDLLVLDMEAQITSADNIRKIKELNPDVIILAYITSQESRYDYINSLNEKSEMRRRLFARISESWWLKNSQGAKISHWPETWMLNLSDGAGVNSNNERWNVFLPRFVKEEIMSTNLWDGVFYDNIWHQIEWVSSDIDIDNNGIKDGADKINQAWISGTQKMLAKTREFLGDKKIIIANGQPYNRYQPYLNGLMYEEFPSFWRSQGNWSWSMNVFNQYYSQNKDPKVNIINATDNNAFSYQKMRFGLASALLVDSYYGFDYGYLRHGDLWWYGEYDIDLGRSLGNAHMLDNSSDWSKNGVWLKEFEKGAVYLNSGPLRVKVRLPEKMMNNGYVNEEFYLESQDGAFFTRIAGTVINSPTSPQINISQTANKELFNVPLLNYMNYEAYGFKGSLARSGIKIESSNFDRLVRLRRLPNSNIYQTAVKSQIADSNFDGYWEKVIDVPKGKPSYVFIYNNLTNKLIGAFTAYPIIYKIGVVTAIGDVDGDYFPEIVTMPAWGGPHVKVFNFNGRLESEFFAGDKNKRLSYDVVVEDINGDGIGEILVGER